MTALPASTLAHDTSGDGPAVVQLHGLGSSRARDRAFGPDLCAVLDRHRVLRYDARGHGDSTGPADPDAYRWPRLAHDLLALLDTVFPGERVHGVGQSMGTATLLHAALLDPDRFVSTTLAIPPTAWALRAARAHEYREGADLVEQEGVAAFVDAVREGPRPPVRAEIPVLPPDVAEGLLPSVLRGAAESDLPDADLVARIATPTLILAWVDDPGHPVATANRLADLLPRTTIAIARTADDVLGWPAAVAAHVGTTERADR